MKKPRSGLEPTYRPTHTYTSTPIHPCSVQSLIRSRSRRWLHTCSNGFEPRLTTSVLRCDVSGSGGVLLPLRAEPSDRRDPDGSLLQAGRGGHEGVHPEGGFIRGLPLLTAKGEHSEGEQVSQTEDGAHPFVTKMLARLSLLLFVLMKYSTSLVLCFIGRK